MAYSALLLLAAGLASGARATTTPLQAAIDAAVAAGRSWTAPTHGAVYEQGNASLTLAGAADFVLDFAGATLVFAPGAGFTVSRCTNTTVRNATVAYSPASFTQGGVVGTDPVARTYDVALDAGWPVPNATVSPWFASAETKLQFWDPASRLRVPGQPGACIVTLAAQVAPRVFRMYLLPRSGAFYAPPVGSLASISPRIGATEFEIPDFYRGGAWAVFASSAVTSEDVTLTGSGNFAVLEWGGEGGHVFRRLNLTRASPQHLLSSNTDGFHSFSTGRGATLVDSALAFHGDDALNFHNRVQLLLDAPSSGSPAHVIDVGDVPTPGGSNAAPARAMADLAVGDVLRLYPSGAAAAPRGVFSVTSFAPVTDAAVLARARTAVAALPSVTVNPAAVAVWAVGLSGVGLGSVAPGDVVQFDRRSSFHGLVANSTFFQSYDSCFRLQASGTTLAGCTFDGAVSGITVVYDPSWLEGSAGLSNVSVVGNTFKAIGDPPATSMAQIMRVDANVVNVTVTGNVVSARARG